MALRLGRDIGQSVQLVGNSEAFLLTVLRISQTGVSIDLSGHRFNNLIGQPFTLTIDGLDVKVDTAAGSVAGRVEVIITAPRQVHIIRSELLE